MPKRRQRPSHRPVPGNGRRHNVVKTPSSSGGYTQKEYLPEEKQRLVELVFQHGDDWKTIVRQYNADFGGQRRKRTQEGLKNKHARDLKLKMKGDGEREGEEMIGLLTGPDNSPMYGWGEASTPSSQGRQTAPADQASCF